MSVIFLLIIVGVIVAGLFLGGFIWAVKSGQYDDTYTPSVRMLFEDEPKEKTDSLSEPKKQGSEIEKGKSEKKKTK